MLGSVRSGAPSFGHATARARSRRPHRIQERRAYGIAAGCRKTLHSVTVSKLEACQSPARPIAAGSRTGGRTRTSPDRDARASRPDRTIAAPGTPPVGPGRTRPVEDIPSSPFPVYFGPRRPDEHGFRRHPTPQSPPPVPPRPSRCPRSSRSRGVPTDPPNRGCRARNGRYCESEIRREPIDSGPRTLTSPRDIDRSGLEALHRAGGTGPGIDAGLPVKRAATEPLPGSGLLGRALFAARSPARCGLRG